MQFLRMKCFTEYNKKNSLHEWKDEAKTINFKRNLNSFIWYIICNNIKIKNLNY